MPVLCHSFSLEKLSDVFKPAGDVDVGVCLDDVKKIVKGRGRQSDYITVTLRDLAPHTFHTIRTSLNIQLITEQYQFTNDLKTSLLLLGAKITGTGLHMDWAEAINISYVVDQNQSDDTLLAKWVFFDSVALDELNSWLKEIGYQGGLSSKVLLNENELLLAHTKFGDKMIVIHQTPCSKVYVPPGWVHQVVNQKPCIKLACELAYEENIPLSEYMG